MDFRPIPLGLVATVGIGVAAGVAQQVPTFKEPDVVVIAPDQPGDIVVVAGRPVLRGGLWRFHRVGSGGQQPYTFSACLPTDDLEETLRRAAFERGSVQAITETGLCGRLRLTIAKGRIAGRRSCSYPSMQIGRSHSTLAQDVSGRYDAASLTISHRVDEQTDGIEPGRSVSRPRSWQWRVTGARAGACPEKPASDQERIERAGLRIFSMAQIDPVS